MTRVYRDHEIGCQRQMRRAMRVKFQSRKFSRGLNMKQCEQNQNIFWHILTQTCFHPQKLPLRWKQKNYNHKSVIVWVVKCDLWWKVVFHQRLSFIKVLKGHLSSKVIFHQRLASIKGCPPSNVFFHQRVSSIKMVFIKQNCQFQDILYFPCCWTVSVS